MFRASSSLARVGGFSRIIKNSNSATNIKSTTTKIPLPTAATSNHSYYTYVNEPSHPLDRQPQIVSVEEAVKCVKSGEKEAQTSRNSVVVFVRLFGSLGKNQFFRNGNNQTSDTTKPYRVYMSVYY